MHPVSSALKPSKMWYWLGALSVLAGLIGGGVVMVSAFTSLNKTVDNFGRIRIPGDEHCQLVFAKPGKYTIYYEYKTELPSRGESCQPTGSQETIDAPEQHPLGLEVSLVDGSGAELATTLSTSGDKSMSLHGHLGSALREVQIVTPGDYRLKVDGVDPNAAPFVLSVGRSGLAHVAPYILLGLAIGGFGTVLGAVGIIVTASRRRAGRRLRANQQAVAGAEFAQPGFPGAPTPSPSLSYPPFTPTPMPSTPPPAPPPAGLPPPQVQQETRRGEDRPPAPWGPPKP
jgi:hypothetical protein